MGIFNIFNKKKKQHGHLDEEIRELGLEVRRKKSALRQLEIDIELEEKRQELAELRQNMFEENPEQMLFDILKQVLPKQVLAKGNSATPSFSPEIPHTQNESLGLSREQINEFYDSLNDSDKKILKNLSDDKLKLLIKNKMPQIDDNSLNLCLEIIKSKK